MHAPAKYVEKGLTWVANGLWYAAQPLFRIAQNESFQPQWADRPLLKSKDKFRPPLGVPRETTSLCPACTRESRQQIVDGKATADLFVQEHAAEIPAKIIERDGKILMVKDCPTHGHFEDVLSTDPAFFKKMEEMYQGSDIPLHGLDGLHNHGMSALRYGRGTVLTVDLTNRCNMMCDPCFTDANQVGFVHEPDWDEVKAILDRAASVKPHRQMSVQFSGGEPTLSPNFLKAVGYCKEIGFNSVQAATNGIEFAKDPEFCRKAAEAGLRFVYLQFDGIGNAANQHRRVANLFDVKMRAIENLHAAGVDIVLVSTIINGVNNEQVGRIVEFALDNPKKISFISFQPVSFTGRDEEISDERRAAQRYTIADLAHDIKRQTGIGEPVRDWFPISMMSTFGDWADLVHGPSAVWGHLNCGCHPDCGSGMAVMIDKQTKERVAVSAFLDGHKLVKDLAVINDAARGRFLSVAGMALSLFRNYDPFKAPSRLRIFELLKKFDKAFGATGRDYGKVGKGRTLADVQKRRSDDWLFLFIAGMWFQDLWTYDFRRTHQCIIPYGTQEGEISFCAYNTGVGWRQVVEKRHQTATLAAWYDKKGRHQIYTGGHLVPLATTEHSLTLNPDALSAGAQHDLELAGVAKTSREEKLKARQHEHTH
jgi:7,8-dihydro-6-hydroxymethylpterin dimethyltransferase